MEENEIMRNIWEGQIATEVTLSADDVSSFEKPDSYFVMLPRLSYITSIFEKIKIHFMKNLLHEKEFQIWFECNGEPLKWHYPVGCLFDLFGDPKSLPWKIIAHLSKFPHDELLLFQNKDDSELNFMYTLKEADAMKHRSAKISSMLKKEHKQLWTGLQNSRKLMETTDGSPFFRYIPLRIYCLHKKSYFQPLIKPMNEGEIVTFNYIESIIKELCNKHESDTKILIHGIQPPGDTPIQWMSKYMSYADNFLHICISN